MLWEHRNLKLYDKVKFKGEPIQGYIDAITDDKYRIKLKEGYLWCHKHEVELANEQIKKEEPKKRNTFNYL